MQKRPTGKSDLQYCERALPYLLSLCCARVLFLEVHLQNCKRDLPAKEPYNIAQEPYNMAKEPYDIVEGLFCKRDVTFREPTMGWLRLVGSLKV